MKQFQRALRTLKLQPYIHASQLIDTVSPEVLHQGKRSSGPGDGSDTDNKDQAEDGIYSEPSVTYLFAYTRQIQRRWSGLSW